MPINRPHFQHSLLYLGATRPDETGSCFPEWNTSQDRKHEDVGEKHEDAIKLINNDQAAYDQQVMQF